MIIFTAFLCWFIVLANGKFRCHKKIDLAILVDCSASVTEDQFAASKEFASKLVKHFDISKKRANVAAISFSQYVHTKQDFKDDTSRESVLKAIDGLFYEGSLTRLDFALETLQGRTFNKAYGARAPSKDVKRAVVAITDGFSTRGFEYTKELTDQLKHRRVKFFSVGTSKRVNKPELDEMSSGQVDIHKLIVDLKNRSSTKAQVERLAKDICE
ncbi:matrilin-2-like [Porites lutea]|uniref:matrilin-2-like n=1 Tax=Porites lutea TaxID=51062 RepID=UPI003CC5DB5E